MGGVAKGLLRLADGATIVERLLSEVRSLLPDAPIFLLGDRPEYRLLPIACLSDDPAGVGPLGGLHALLQQPCDEVLLLGGDMPYLTADVIDRLLRPELVTAIAATSGTPQRWEPMLSRYRVASALPVVEQQLAERTLGLFALLDRLRATPLTLTPDEASVLRDWDTPEDVVR